MKNFILILLALVVLGGVWLLIRKPSVTPVVTNVTPTDNTVSNDNTVTPTNNGTVTDGSIVVDLPKANATSSSPITLSGKARGNWYFEGTAPVTVIDASGKTIGQGKITATGDWMTTEYVPFTGSVAYTLPKGTSTDAFVLFMNDNPSGDPSRSISIRVPIHLKR